MLNKEDILALAWEHSEGSGKRYTFTEESLFAFLKELKKEQAPAQDERHSGLLERIDAAIKAFTSGRASMHVPPEPTDVDFVLEECRKFIVATCSAQKVNNVDTPEQQPVAHQYKEKDGNWYPIAPGFIGSAQLSGYEVRPLYAAPIAQTSQETNKI